MNRLIGTFTRVLFSILFLLIHSPNVSSAELTLEMIRSVRDRMGIRVGTADNFAWAGQYVDTPDNIAWLSDEVRVQREVAVRNVRTMFDGIESDFLAGRLAPVQQDALKLMATGDGRTGFDIRYNDFQLSNQGNYTPLDDWSNKQGEHIVEFGKAPADGSRSSREILFHEVGHARGAIQGTNIGRVDSPGMRYSILHDEMVAELTATGGDIEKALRNVERTYGPEPMQNMVAQGLRPAGDLDGFTEIRRSFSNFDKMTPMQKWQLLNELTATGKGLAELTQAEVQTIARESMVLSTGTRGYQAWNQITSSAVLNGSSGAVPGCGTSPNGCLTSRQTVEVVEISTGRQVSTESRGTSSTFTEADRAAAARNLKPGEQLVVTSGPDAADPRVRQATQLANQAEATAVNRSMASDPVARGFHTDGAMNAGLSRQLSGVVETSGGNVTGLSQNWSVGGHPVDSMTVIHPSDGAPPVIRYTVSNTGGSQSLTAEVAGAASRARFRAVASTGAGVAGLALPGVISGGITLYSTGDWGLAASNAGQAILESLPRAGAEMALCAAQPELAPFIMAYGAVEASPDVALAYDTFNQERFQGKLDSVAAAAGVQSYLRLGRGLYSFKDESSQASIATERRYLDSIQARLGAHSRTDLMQFRLNDRFSDSSRNVHVNQVSGTFEAVVNMNTQATLVTNGGVGRPEAQNEADLQARFREEVMTERGGYGGMALRALKLSVNGAAAYQAHKAAVDSDRQQAAPQAREFQSLYKNEVERGTQSAPSVPQIMNESPRQRGQSSLGQSYVDPARAAIPATSTQSDVYALRGANFTPIPGYRFDPGISFVMGPDRVFRPDSFSPSPRNLTAAQSATSSSNFEFAYRSYVDLPKFESSYANQPLFQFGQPGSGISTGQNIPNINMLIPSWRSGYGFVVCTGGC